MKSASWAVVKTSGTPPAAVQSSSSGTGHRGALVDDGELGLAAAGDDRHHAVAGLEAPDAAPAGDDLARELQARDVGRGARAARDSARRAASCRRR